MSNGSNTKLNAKKTHPTFHFVAGLFSGISSAILLQPADLLKTRVQQSGAQTLSQTLRSILSGPHPITSLWRGTVPSALRTGFGSALYFTSLSSLRQLAANTPSITTSSSSQHDTQQSRRSTVLPTLSPTANLVTGATARTLAGFILMPMTIIKVRYESSLYTYRSLSAATTSIYRSEGLRGFFTGFGATAIRDAPYAGLYVLFYESSKTFLNKTLPTNTADTATGGLLVSGTSINALSGVVAATTSTAITNPFDAVKTRLQLQPGRYGNMWRAARLMFKDDGLRSFFDGLGLRMGRKALSSALAWTVYEELIGRTEKRLLRAEKQQGTAAL